MNIHFIAIGGSIMHSLAIELKKNGHNISGSDDSIYEPSKSNLINNNLFPNYKGWKDSLINKNLDMVILGMHAKKDNPELLMAQRIGVPIFSFPEFIANNSIHKQRIVISGSHGKTTITSMILHVLNTCSIPCDYVVGAHLEGIDNQVRLQNNSAIIIEGDEYLSSCIDTKPKFHYYKPNILVVSGVAWDHINVFPTESSYQEVFKNLIFQCSNSCNIFYCAEDQFLSDICVNKSNANPYGLPSYVIRDNKFILINKTKHYPLKIFGKHNLLNIQAAKNVCLKLGVSEQEFFQSITSFSGASKRLTLLKESKDQSIYLDFAHSPSKVQATISAVKELYPNRELIACLELHTFSSLNKSFFIKYYSSFELAEEVWIYYSHSPSNKKPVDLDVNTIKGSISNAKLCVINYKDKLYTKIINSKNRKVNMLFMSSGNFSGLDIKSLFD